MSEIPKSITNASRKTTSQGNTATSHQDMAMLRLLKAKEKGKSAQDILLIKTENPWAIYERIYDMTLGMNEPFLVVERKSIAYDLFSMRRFATLTDDHINMLELIQHPNFATAQEIYKLEDSYLVVFEHIPLSLAEAVGNPFLNRPRLAAIIGQVWEEPSEYKRDCLIILDC